MAQFTRPRRAVASFRQGSFAIGARLALPDDQCAWHLVRSCWKRFGRVPGITTARGGDRAARFDGFRTSNIQDGRAAVKTTLALSTASLPTCTPSTTMQREPMNAPSSTITGAACSGSSTPPMPTPPLKWTSAPIWAHEPRCLCPMVRSPRKRQGSRNKASGCNPWRRGRHSAPPHAAQHAHLQQHTLFSEHFVVKLKAPLPQSSWTESGNSKDGLLDPFVDLQTPFPLRLSHPKRALVEPP